MRKFLIWAVLAAIALLVFAQFGPSFLFGQQLVTSNQISVPGSAGENGRGQP